MTLTVSPDIFIGTKPNINRRRLLCGVGVNDASYSTRVQINGKEFRCPYYEKWGNLISRCYREPRRAKDMCYEGCSVSDDWLYFSNFRSWMETQDWEDKHLDKDILFPGNKVYSAKTCIFVPYHINQIIKPHTKSGKYPKGVLYNKITKRYNIQFRIKGKMYSRGGWDTPEEAHMEYKKIKYAELIKEANQITDEKLKNALYNYAKILYD